MSAGISDPTRPDAARELGGLQIIDNRPLAVSLLRPDEFSRLDPAMLNVSGGGGSGTDGYEKKLSFDQRLDFVSPPFIIPGSVPFWVLNNYVECLNATCPALG
jgi:hypothetical protein